jgi:hypothetical protein
VNETSQIMNALKADFEAKHPARKCFRSFVDFNDRAEADLVAGCITFVAGPESGFPNYRGREGNFGDLQVLVIAQIKVGEKVLPEKLEDAESDMIDELKAYTRSAPPVPIDSVVINDIRRSHQLEFPYGWVAFDLEVMKQ